MKEDILYDEVGVVIWVVLRLGEVSGGMSCHMNTRGTLFTVCLNDVRDSTSSPGFVL